MYSDKKNVSQLVALLKAHGITQLVLSPGSRNAPLIHSFATDSDFTCYSIVDERSAGFFAIGIIEARQQPVAVCCTSGTAALNLGPAVAEAYYQQLPLLVITADRPLAWTGQTDGQTIPQSGMFEGLVRRSVHLPEVKDEEEEWHCNRLINEAILSLDNDSRGPAHINIPLSEPLFTFDTEKLPTVRVIRRPKPIFTLPPEEQYATRFRSFSRKMIIAGQLPPGNRLAKLMKTLSGEQGVVVLADQLSNIPAGEYPRFDGGTPGAGPRTGNHAGRTYCLQAAEAVYPQGWHQRALANHSVGRGGRYLPIAHRHHPVRSLYLPASPGAAPARKEEKSVSGVLEKRLRSGHPAGGTLFRSARDRRVPATIARRSRPPPGKQPRRLSGTALQYSPHGTPFL